MANVTVLPIRLPTAKSKPLRNCSLPRVNPNRCAPIDALIHSTTSEKEIVNVRNPLRFICILAFGDSGQQKLNFAVAAWYQPSTEADVLIINKMTGSTAGWFRRSGADSSPMSETVSPPSRLPVRCRVAVRARPIHHVLSGGMQLKRCALHWRPMLLVQASGRCPVWQRVKVG